MTGPQKEITIAVEGCGHGTLNNIYSAVQAAAKKNNKNVSLLIICGDFQAVRNENDLPCMSVPPKYRKLGDFHRYYSGELKAPIPTLFIGGNHEASNYLWELYYGGWVAPDIYYLGAGGVINFGGIKIAGLSGIYKPDDYTAGRYERVPYTHSDMRSTYHVRAYDVFKLFQLQDGVDIGLSHDWPAGIEHHGDLRRLLQQKKHFETDIKKGELGSPPAMNLLKKWRPFYWFSAHLHVKFPAVVKHDKVEQSPKVDTSAKVNDDEIDLDMDDADPATSAAEHGNNDEIDLELSEEEKRAPTVEANKDEIDLELSEDEAPSTARSKANDDEIDLDISDAEGGESREKAPIKKEKAGDDKSSARHAKHTKFLSLDKCEPNRHFLQLLTIRPKEPKTLEFRYDPEWLAITRAFNPLLSDNNVTIQELEEAAKKIPEELDWVVENIVKKGKLKVPQNFSVTAPVQDLSKPPNLWTDLQAPEYKNPQTVEFCNLLEMEDKINSSMTDEERNAKIEQFLIKASEDKPRGGGGSGGGGGRAHWGGGRGGRGGRGRGRGRGR